MKLPDIKPQTQIALFNRDSYASEAEEFEIGLVARLTGMSDVFVRKACGRKKRLSIDDVKRLLDLDCYSETYVPRSRIIEYLLSLKPAGTIAAQTISDSEELQLIRGNAIDLIRKLSNEMISCVVTSTPYWGMRLYKDSYVVDWADGDSCVYGHEQTPEAFIRHSTEILAHLIEKLKPDASVWWNIMDSFNTRTQIRGNASEALKAMQGKDRKSWGDHQCRRYSAGHSFLKDGEQCGIPGRIAERASRLGYYLKSTITWAKTSSLPEPQESRVSRNLEYILHFSKQRTPKFNKDSYRALLPSLGGRNPQLETDKLSDVWILSTSSGRDGHGAQFPIALPARCIALSTNNDDLILDPFVGAGNSGVASRLLSRKFIGFDVSEEYLDIAKTRINDSSGELPLYSDQEPAWLQPPSHSIGQGTEAAGQEAERFAQSPEGA
jgi:DNA modification methylase